MPTVPVADRTAAPPAPAMPELPTVAIVPGREPAALTSRGTAAARLSDFQDQWALLTAADRAWFAEWLTELLVDACIEVPVLTA